MWCRARLQLAALAALAVLAIDDDPILREAIAWINTQVMRLRRKLETDPAKPRYILTERGADTANNHRHGEEPGADIALHVARHGVNLEVQRATSHGTPIARVILEHGKRAGSDLLVIGAYSHARLKELLLGGVTRTFLAQMPVPILISR